MLGRREKVLMRRLIVTVAVVLGLLVIATPGQAATVVSTSSAPGYVALLPPLVDLLDSENGTYGLHIIDLNSGQSLGINENEVFHAASTFKLPLNLFLYEQIAAGRVDPKKKLAYLPQHYEGGSGILQSGAPGELFTIAALSKYSIVYSDNVATNMLLDYLGYQQVKQYMRALGGRVVDDKRNTTCPSDMTVYMIAALDFAREHPAEGRVLFSHLENTIYNDRLPKLLPPGVVVAHKIGSWPATGTYNDVGYVGHPHNPYVIAVFSKNTASQSRAFDVIQRISRLVYDYQDGINIKLSVNGREITTEVPPLLDQGCVLVPLRVLSDAMGADVTWDPAGQAVQLFKNNVEIKLVLNSPQAIINDREVTLSPPVRTVCNRTLIPLRFIAEVFGAQVRWDSSQRAVDVVLDPADRHGTFVPEHGIG